MTGSDQSLLAARQAVPALLGWQRARVALAKEAGVKVDDLEKVLGKGKFLNESQIARVEVNLHDSPREFSGGVEF